MKWLDEGVNLCTALKGVQKSVMNDPKSVQVLETQSRRLLIDGDNTQSFTSSRSTTDCNIMTCQTWKDAGKGIREVFTKLIKGVDLRENTRILNVKVLKNGKKRIHDEYDNIINVDRVVFACPANAIGNIHKSAGWLPIPSSQHWSMPMIIIQTLGTYACGHTFRWECD
jgi:hypothetical protein